MLWTWAGVRSRTNVCDWGGGGETGLHSTEDSRDPFLCVRVISRDEGCGADKTRNDSCT